MSTWTSLTNFGDSFVMLPAAATVLLFLLLERNWRAALYWTLLFSGGVFLVAATKIAFIGWGQGIRALNFTGLSGHSTLSAAVFPTVLYLTTQGMSRRWRYAGVLLGVLIAVAVAVSRVKLAAHSSPEAALGVTTGLCVSLAFMLSYRPKLQSPRFSRAAGIGTALLCVFLHGNNAPTQDLITRVALYLAHRATPHSREELWGLRLQRAADALD